MFAPGGMNPQKQTGKAKVFVLLSGQQDQAMHYDIGTVEGCSMHSDDNYRIV